MTPQGPTQSTQSPRSPLSRLACVALRRGLCSIGLAMLLPCIGAGAAFGVLGEEAPSFHNHPISVEKITHTSEGPFEISFFEAGINEMKWSLEYASSESGPWSQVPGGSGSAPAGTRETQVKGGELTGLEPEKSYYFRAQAENGSKAVEEPVYGPPLSERPERFETTPLRPRLGRCAILKFFGPSATVHCSLLPDGSETSWRVEDAKSQKALEEGKGTVVSSGTVTNAEAEELETKELSGDEGAYNTGNLDVTELEPEKRPSAKQVRELYPRLLSINSTFHKWYLERSLELLSDEFEDDES